MNTDIQLLLQMSYSFSSIQRDIYYPDRERHENDAEHSFQLALIAWHIIEVDKLKLDAAKVFKLCLAHDLVELYAGDVPLWGNVGHEEKEGREKIALETIREKFENVNDVPDVISEYKARKTEEAKFVCGLDKLLPLLNQMNTEGKIWKNHNITLNQAVEVLGRQAKISTYLGKYFIESTDYLIKNKEKFFNTY